MTKKRKKKFFVSVGGKTKQVSKKVYIETEMAAGFFSKIPGQPATASFSKSDLAGIEISGWVKE